MLLEGEETVSIVMSTHNRASTLPWAIQGAVRQTHADWELTVVDDGSTDETSRIPAQMKDSRFKTYRHLTNRGVTAAKNTGLDHIRGDWSTLLEDDDEVRPDALAVMLECA